MNFEVLGIMQDLKNDLEVLNLLQALRDDFQSLDEKIVSGDTMDVKELIEIVENKLNKLKTHF